MTRTELLSLPNPDLDRLAATLVMGWTRKVYSSWRMEERAEPFEDATYNPGKDGYGTDEDDWHPSTNITDAKNYIMAEIKRRGLQSEFSAELTQLINSVKIFDIADADPRPITQAACLAVMEGGK